MKVLGYRSAAEIPAILFRMAHVGSSWGMTNVKDKIEDKIEDN